MEIQYGDPRLPQRFWVKVEVLTNTCWQWHGSISVYNYGRIVFERYRWPAHRLAYARLVAPVPDDKVIDHLCRNTLCVNPAHLEPVSSVENVRRGDGMSSRNARRTHCTHGHLLTPENVAYYGPTKQWRSCKTCNREHAHAYHHDPVRHEEVLEKKRTHDARKRQDASYRMQQNARRQARYHDPALHDQLLARALAHSDAYRARHRDDPEWRAMKATKQRAYRARRKAEQQANV